MKKNGLTRLEMLVRETVEGSFGRLFGGYLEPMDVATQLVQIMEDSTSSPDQIAAYDVLLHPSDYQHLLDENPRLAEDLAEAAWGLGRRYGLPLATRPKIRLVEDSNGRRHSFQIKMRSAAADGPGVDTTQVISHGAARAKAISAIEALDAFLIVQGKRHYALNKALITIGRRPDNDIMLDSSTVSRQHAQLRWRFDRFILYDVSNRGRTQVNGETVSECILHPGDVIALSDALLIYGEGNEREKPDQSGDPPDDTNTLILAPGKS